VIAQRPESEHSGRALDDESPSKDGKETEHLSAPSPKSEARLAVSRSLEPVLLRVLDGILRQALSQAFDVAPDGAAADELERQREDLLHVIVKEILDGALNGSAEAELEPHDQQVLAAALHRDGAAVQSDADAALSTVAGVVSQVLQDHRKDLVEIATRILPQAKVEVATNKVKDGTRPMGTKADHESEEDDEPVTEDAKTDETTPARHVEEDRDSQGSDAGREIRDQLEEAGKTLKRQLSTQTNELQQRLRRELGSEVKSSMQNQNLGRAPAGGHPSTRNPAPRGPSQAAPGTRRRQ
jgi:hypothetical protein